MKINLTDQELDSKYFVHYASEWIKEKLFLSPEYDKYSVLRKAMLDESVKLRRFKKRQILPRIEKVFSIMKNLEFESVLDVGIGNGAFIWHLLDTFPDIRVHAVDKFSQNGVDAVNLASKVRKGITAATLCDCCDLPFKDGEFECTTALEVLEHIPEAEKAMKELVRVSSKYVFVSVPSVADNNIDHVHFFNEGYLIEKFTEYGMKKIKPEYVLNHLILFMRK